jgi:hypothetical protein
MGLQTAPDGNLTPLATLRARAAVSQFRHTVRFSDYPQVHSGAGDVINKGNVRLLRVEKNIVLTA